MAEQVTKLGVGWNVDIGDLKKQLGQIPNISEAEAKKMVGRLEYQWKQANKAANKALKQQQRDAEDAFKNMGEGAKNAASAIGGSVGGMAGQLENAIRAASSFTSALGPAGTGVLALGAAVGGVTLGMGALGAAAVEAQEALTDVGLAALIPAEARESANQYRATTNALGNSVDALVVTYGSDFIPMLTQASTALLTGVDAAIQYHDRIVDIGHAIGVLASGGSLLFYEQISAKTDELATGSGWLATQLQRVGVATDTTNTSLDSTGTAVGSLVDKYGSANKELLAFTDTLSNKNLPVVARIEREYIDALDKIQQFKDSNSLTADQEQSLVRQAQLNKDVALAAVAKQEAEKRAAEEAARASRAQAEARMQEADAARAASAALSEKTKLLDEERKAQERIASINEQVFSIRKQYEDQLLSGADAINQRYDDEIARLKALATETTNLSDVAAATSAIEANRLHDLQALRQETDEKANEAARQSAENQIEHIHSIRDAAFSITQSIGEMFTSLYGIAASAAADAVDEEIAQTERLAKRLDNINEQINNSKKKQFELQHDGTVSQAQLEHDKHLEQLKQNRDTLKERLKSQRQEHREAKRHALEMWKVTRSMQLAQVPIMIAASILQAFAQFGPPPSPAGIAAAAAAVTAGVTQTAAIATAKPPKFHTGLAPDEMPATIQKREAILTPRATSMLGKQTIQALNDGQPIATSPVVHVYIDGREVAKHLKLSKSQPGIRGTHAQRTR